MQITWNKILRAFYHLTVLLYIIGVVANIVDNNFDIYQAWGLVALIVGSYLIESKAK